MFGRFLLSHRTKENEGKTTRPTSILVLGFLAIIAAGAFLLMLPISSRAGQWTDPLTTIFTATSATCVTGLILVDTYTYWSTFGQTVILLMIQVGGLGFMTMATLFSFLLRRTITLRERMVMTTSLNVSETAGIVRLTRRVLMGTLFFESIGAIILSIRFACDFGVVEGIRKGIFHSISAFCNAGFDLMGQRSPFSSVTAYVDDPVVNITLMLLISIGGMGFYVWNDLYEHERRRRLNVHTKVVLITTAMLIVVGAIVIGAYEWDNPYTMGRLSPGGKILAALFQSTTLRTAGFNTIDQAAMRGPSKIISMVLMFIGGSPGSTAGGIKTVTFAVLLMTGISALRGRSQVVVHGRTISQRSIMNAVTMMMVGLVLVGIGGFVLMGTENATTTSCLFEVISAFGTVGVSMGLTTAVGTLSKLTLIVLMYLGRVGVLTLGVAVLMGRHTESTLRYPEGNVFVG